MNILILNWRDIRHPLAGGAEIATHEYAKGWINAGHTVTQFSSHFPRGKKNETIDSVEFVRAGSHYTVHIHAFLWFLFSKHKKYDIIIDEFHFLPFFTPLYTRTKKIAYIHEIAREAWFKNVIFPFSFIGYFIEFAFFILYKNIQFITVSESTKTDLIKYGISSKNVHVIHNGSTFIMSTKKKSRKPILVYLGKLAEDKGVKDAIEAALLVKKKVPAVHLWIVGKEERKSYAKALKENYKNKNISEFVTFFGYVTEYKKFDLLRQASVLIHPSIKEGWGLTVIEAASQMTPTVGYKSTGLVDSIQHNKTGILVSKKDAAALAEATITLLKNKSHYRALSKNCIRWSKQFKWENAVKKSLLLINNLS